MVDGLLDVSQRLVGLYDAGGRQRGFSRTVTDGVAVAYLADVYVHPEVRGRGLGVELVRFTVDEVRSRTRAGSSTPTTRTTCTAGSIRRARHDRDDPAAGVSGI